MRQTRSSMLETLSTDYVRTARAKGLPRGKVLRDYALRNSLIVVVTIIGLQLGGLISARWSPSGSSACRASAS